MNKAHRAHGKLAPGPLFSLQDATVCVSAKTFWIYTWDSAERVSWLVPGVSSETIGHEALPFTRLSVPEQTWEARSLIYHLRLCGRKLILCGMMSDESGPPLPQDWIPWDGVLV